MATQKGKDPLVEDRRRRRIFNRRGSQDEKPSRSTRKASMSRTRNLPDAGAKLLAGAGVKRASLTASGIFKDAASDALVRQKFFDDALCSCS